MRAQTVETKESTGRILCCTVFRSGGKKLLSKGHMISEEDIRLLKTQGMRSVWVTELEEGEVAEDEAVMIVADEVACGSLEIRLAAGGRANLVATEDCCVLVDDELLRLINGTSSAAIATRGRSPRSTSTAMRSAGSRSARTSTIPTGSSTSSPKRCRPTARAT